MGIFISYLTKNQVRQLISESIMFEHSDAVKYVVKSDSLDTSLGAKVKAYAYYRKSQVPFMEIELFDYGVKIDLKNETIATNKRIKLEDLKYSESNYIKGMTKTLIINNRYGEETPKIYLDAYTDYVQNTATESATKQFKLARDLYKQVKDAGITR